MEPLADYERQVYAGLLGKVIGVYWGRPFENWSRADIEKRWGTVDHYVHEDVGVPLVVADDDITGTLTFVRALTDSRRYADTPVEFFGRTWLNYLLENQTSLWWGGLGVSTEHTAFLRLRQGLPAPASGSIAVNGREVAEQIGGQIFIDAFGLVAPGRPGLAADLAEKSARVSHDGEAVFAARVVASMIAAAFVEKDIDRLLDTGLQTIPSDSAIAQVHRDVRAWAAADGDWRRTFERIDATYGYRRHGGACHVIPNHALMVMAWAYGRDDFYETMKIVGTAGWDTDCNAANVGTVTALIVGLEGIDRRYPFRTPFADRLVVTVADGTDGVADVLRRATELAAVGRRIMGWPTRPAPKDGAWHHFSQPGALHGYLPDDSDFRGRRRAATRHLVLPPTPDAPVPEGHSGLAFDFRTGPGCFARILTPTAPSPRSGTYPYVGVPYLYPGMTMRVVGRALTLTAPASLRMAVRVQRPPQNKDVDRPAPEWFRSDPLPLTPGQPFDWAWRIPPDAEARIQEFGFEAEASEAPSEGCVWVDRVDAGGEAEVSLAWSDAFGPRTVPGWISHLDTLRGSFPHDPPGVWHIGKSGDDGLLVTGHRRWTDTTLSCDFNIPLARRAGFVLRYQGLCRGYLFLFENGCARIVRRHYGETVLAEVPFDLPANVLRPMTASARGRRLALSVDGHVLLEAEDGTFAGGGAGFWVDGGLCGFRACAVLATVDQRNAD